MELINMNVQFKTTTTNLMNYFDPFYSIRNAILDRNYIQFIIAVNDYLDITKKKVYQNPKKAYERIVELCELLRKDYFQDTKDFMFGKIYVLIEKLIQQEDEEVNDQLIDFMIDYYYTFDFTELFYQYYQDPIYRQSKIMLAKRMIYNSEPMNIWQRRINALL